MCEQLADISTNSNPHDVTCPEFLCRDEENAQGIFLFLTTSHLIRQLFENGKTLQLDCTYRLQIENSFASKTLCDGRLLGAPLRARTQHVA